MNQKEINSGHGYTEAGYYKEPLKEDKFPEMVDFGWYDSNSQEEESGWMYEEGEEKYFEAVKEWEKRNDNR